MILLIDVGNSNINIGLYNKEKITNKFQIKSMKDKTSDEYYVIFDGLIKNYNIEGAIISSVVPVITSAINKMLVNHYNITPMIVGKNIKTGMKIVADDPRSVGTDLVCECSGAMNFTNEALIIVLSTATKFLYVKDYVFNGAVIAPGVSISMNALVNNTALLPSVELVVPKKILGNNTISCMQSGILNGSASFIDGMIERIKEEIKNPNLKVIATGGLSKLIIPLCKYKDIIIEENLTLLGLVNIYNKNI